MEENHGAIHVQLTAADLREIDTGLSKITVHGGRMSGRHVAAVDR